MGTLWVVRSPTPGHVSGLQILTIGKKAVRDTPVLEWAGHPLCKMSVREKRGVDFKGVHTQIHLRFHSTFHKLSFFPKETETEMETDERFTGWFTAQGPQQLELARTQLNPSWPCRWEGLRGSRCHLVLPWAPESRKLAPEAEPGLESRHLDTPARDLGRDRAGGHRARVAVRAGRRLPQPFCARSQSAGLQSPGGDLPSSAEHSFGIESGDLRITREEPGETALAWLERSRG